MPQATTIPPFAEESAPQPEGADGGQGTQTHSTTTAPAEVSAQSTRTLSTPSFHVNIAPTGQHKLDDKFVHLPDLGMQHISINAVHWPNLP